MEPLRLSKVLFQYNETIFVKWWDTRNFAKPTETVILDPTNEDTESQGNVDNAYTPSTLEYDPTIPARYMVKFLFDDL